MHHLLTYEKIPDHAVREQPLHDAHRDHVRSASVRGDLILAGSLGGDDDLTAMLVFESADVAGAFARQDPYVTAGIVVRWTVRPWDLVVGADRLRRAGA